MRSLRALSISSLLVLVALPFTARALEGIGPRVSIVGDVLDTQMSKQQIFDKVGGTLIVKARNGQVVTVVLDASSRIIPEGKLSRRTMNPTDVEVRNRVKVSGRRVDGKTIAASLIVIMNVEKNPDLTAEGILQAVGPDSVTVQLANGVPTMYGVNNDTIFYVSYTITGPEALTLIGKQVFLTMNPQNPNQLKVLRLTGAPPLR